MPSSTSPIAPTTPGAFKDVSSAVAELKSYCRGDGLSAAELVRRRLLDACCRSSERLTLSSRPTDGLGEERWPDVQRHPDAARPHQLQRTSACLRPPISQLLDEEASSLRILDSARLSGLTVRDPAPSHWQASEVSLET